MSAPATAPPLAPTQRALAAELRERLERAADGGGAVARERHRSRGKLLPRECVTRLLDEGSPFLRSHRWPAKASTTGRPRPRGSSPGSASCTGGT